MSTSTACPGMLLSIVDVDVADEDDFHRWSDREHLRERVSIPGFVDARRYVSDSSTPRYLSVYRTDNFSVLMGPDYAAALAHQTEWSRRNLARLQNVQRALARITFATGTVRGAALELVRIRPPASRSEEARAGVKGKLEELLERSDVVYASLVEADAALSKPLGASEAPLGAGDWYLLLEGRTQTQAREGLEQFRRDFEQAWGQEIVSGTYRLLTMLSRADIN